MADPVGPGAVSVGVWKGRHASVLSLFAPQGKVLVVEVRGDGREGVELAVQLCDLLFRFAELAAEGVQFLVSADFAGGPQDLAGDLGVPLGKDVLGPVDGRVADPGLAGQVFLGQGPVGANGFRG
ncbi:hypothetical protein [Streptomyces cinereoruber]|uniref:hypothetical protein n=1 Tax=Streptomyces cinereoruber TaxID=67260 RepID=UPI0036410F3F